MNAGNAAAPRYYCLLDEQPHHLIPFNQVRPVTGTELIANPNMWFSWRTPASGRYEAAVGAASDLLPAECMVWVEDTATGAMWPYWVGNQLISYINELVPGCPAPRALPPMIVWVLVNAAILVPRDHGYRTHWQWWHTSQRLMREFRLGYSVLPSQIPLLHIGAIRRFYRQCVRCGCMTLGDGQVNKRFVAHNDPFGSFLNAQLTGVVGTVVGRRVKPSYAYLAAYQSGSILKSHTDREQCEYTITFCVDAAPEPAGKCEWSINLDTQAGTVRLFQEIGEGLLFLGRRFPHHRDRLPMGRSVTCLLLHFVDDGFRGARD
jgi:hypothetical protein